MKNCIINAIFSEFSAKVKFHCHKFLKKGKTKKELSETHNK